MTQIQGPTTILRMNQTMQARWKRAVTTKMDLQILPMVPMVQEIRGCQLRPMKKKKTDVGLFSTHILTAVTREATLRVGDACSKDKLRGL